MQSSTLPGGHRCTTFFVAVHVNYSAVWSMLACSAKWWILCLRSLCIKIAGANLNEFCGETCLQNAVWSICTCSANAAFCVCVFCLYKDYRDSFDCSETWWCSDMSMQFRPCGHAVQKWCFPCLMILCIKVIWTRLKIVYQRSSFRIVLRLISLDHAVRFFLHVHNSPMWKPKTPNRKKKEGNEVQRCVKWKMVEKRQKK